MYLLLRFPISRVGCANGRLQSFLLLCALSALRINKYAVHTQTLKAEKILQEAMQCGSHKSHKK